jgi:hypothetical protein
MRRSQSGVGRIALFGNLAASSCRLMPSDATSLARFGSELRPPLRPDASSVVRAIQLMLAIGGRQNDGQ